MSDFLAGIVTADDFRKELFLNLSSVNFILNYEQPVKYEVPRVL